MITRLAMSITTRALPAGCALCLATPVPGQARQSPRHFPPSDELTELIRSRVEEERSVGIVLGVMEADGSTRVVSFGDPGAGARPLGEQSVFEIGSISKVFTGILLADMVARGEVSLTDPVSMYLPDEVTVPTRGGREITLLDLSTHHSALPRMPDNFRPANPANPYVDYSVEQMYAFLSGYELPRDIGAEFEYSNFAAGLLGHVLAGVVGGSYEEVVRERILDPLGMGMTTVTLDGPTRDWMTRGHNERGDVVPHWDIPTLAGAGALRSNMTDMLTFLAANVGEPTSDLERAMRASHEPRERASAEASVGLNWMTRHVGDASILWHNGGTGGFRTFVGFDPDARIGVVVLTNSAHVADDIGFHLINPELPLAPPPTEDPPEVVEARYDAASQWVRQVFDGEFELAAERVHPAVAAQLSANALRAAVNQLNAQLGELRSLEPREQSLAQGMNLVVLTGVFANGTFDVQVYMDDSHAVAGFFVRPPGG